jgi:flavin-dependent dehydrogenase
MLTQTEAEVWLARATGYTDGIVTTTQGIARGRFVVDATGWRSWRGQALQPARPVRHAGYGLETELPVRVPLSPGLHFHFEKRLVPNGYAWVFPCGPSTRFGIGSFEKSLRLRLLLDHFVERFGLQAGVTHGGVLAIERSSPVVGGLFAVGDAAGQCLPMSGEGIRTAIFHGIHCGRAIAATLSGDLSAKEAQNLYREQAHSMDRFHSRLLQLQTVVARTPEPLLALAGWTIGNRPALTRRLMDHYLIRSGWFLA